MLKPLLVAAILAAAGGAAWAQTATGQGAGVDQATLEEIRQMADRAYN